MSCFAAAQHLRFIANMRGGPGCFAAAQHDMGGYRLFFQDERNAMPNPHRQEKLGELIAVEISDLLRNRVKDPRVGFASITRVEVSGDFRHAKIFVSVMGSPQEQQETMKAIKHAAGFLRHELATRLTLRYVPELNFRLDKSIEKGAQVLDLIRQVELEEQQQALAQEQPQEQQQVEAHIQGDEVR